MKKSNSNLILLMAFFWAFMCGSLLAQTNLNLAANGVTPGSPFTIAPPTTCSFNFFDSGGSTLNYNNGANANVTFLPSNAATHRIQVTFTTFSLEPGYDAFYIYNSNTVGTNQVPGPQGATFAGFPAGNWQNISPGTITASKDLADVGVNPTEALTFQFRSDNSISYPGWTAVVRQVTKDPCAMTAPAAQTVNTGLGALSCFGNVSTPIPTFAPAGCNTGSQIRYRINGGLPTNVSGSGPVNLTVPVGSNIVTWELVDPCGGGIITTGNQSITVIDNTPPTITCPGNVVFNLDGGQCEQSYNYSVSCSDICPFTVIQSVTHPYDGTTGQAGVMFDVVNLSANPLTISQFGPSLDAGTHPMEVYFTNASSTWVGNDQNPAAWTLAGAISVTSSGPGSGTAIPGYGITLAPGQSLGIYLTSTAGAPMRYTNGVRQVADANLRVSSNPGSGKVYPFATTFQNRSYNGFVSYSTVANQAPVQLSGLPSGSYFPIGTTVNVFRCTDATGLSATCSFSVTVKEYPNPTWVLTCSDFITVALADNTCSAKIHADDILDGGPYRCYDNYVVEIDKIAPFGNGPWVPADLTSADIGKTYRVRITEPINGNKCYSDVKVLDNVKPKISCRPSEVTIPCNYSTDPRVASTTALSLNFPTDVALPVLVHDKETREFSIPVAVSPGAVVNDVDFRTKISGDAFFNNLRIQVISPSGTIVTVWNEFTGCAPAPIFTRFDDEGSDLLDCATYTTDINAEIPLGLGSLSSFDGEDANGTWIIRVTDTNGGLPSTISSVDIAELHITALGTFGAGFPNDLTPPQVTPLGLNGYNVPAGLLDECASSTLTYFDQVAPQGCNSIYTKIITRRWTATDLSGNSSTCIQTINLLRPRFDDVVAPPDYDDIDKPAFECGSEYPTPSWIQNQGLQGFPYVFGLPDICNLNTAYQDTRVGNCDGSYDILRTWTVIDPCVAMGSMLYEQVIHVRDQSGPTFVDCPADMVETTDPYTCCASFNFPDILVEDNCSRINNVYALVLTIDPFTGDTTSFIPVDGGLYDFPGNLPNYSDTLASFGNMPCIPLGRHIVVYFAQDDCGNVGTCSFRLTVADYSPPQAACDETTVVSVGVDDPQDCYYKSSNGCEFAGVTWVKSETFNDGSYDQCSPIKYTVRRAPPYSDCIKALDQSSCNGSPSGLSEYEIATAESDSIKFYCCETNTTQMVILRVYQLNYNGNISNYPDGTPVYNECEIAVTVQDRLKPICESPLNVTVSCENFDPSLWVYGKAKVYDNCCLDPTKEYLGQKGLSHTVNYSQFDTICNKGTIVRTFRAYDCQGATSQCTQRIVVNYEQDYFIKFPDDKVISVCDGTGVYGEPTFFGEDCELLGVSYQDQIFTVVPDACFKIERTWKVINWCTYNPQVACVAVPNPNPNSNSSSPTNLPGPTVSPAGTAGPWSPTVVKINPNDAQATNFSTFWYADANCYTYKQIIKVIDNQAPAIQCPPSPVEYCDLTDNNPRLWNESYWYDPVIQSHDLADAPTDLSIVASDLCSGSNLTVRYILILDLDSDGIMETVVSSSNLPLAGTVNFDNVSTPNFTGGTVRTFDERQVSAAQKYRFALQTVANGTSLTASVRWNSQAAQSSYVVPELPYGTHKIKWVVGDGCGNEAVCEYTFVVKDCHPPAIVCTNGLSVNMTAWGMAVLYASDFLVYSSDNNTPDDQLEFGIIKSGTGAGFPLDANGNPVVSLQFNCDEIGTQPVELWVNDAAGNTDYCETYIIIQDNGGNCVTDMATVSGALKTEGGEGLEESDVELSGQNPAGPSFDHFDLTDHSGAYDFIHAVPVFSNYVVTPALDNNPLNGVTTYDLVLISKHILGIQPLGSPYKMIAADANMSNSITTFDLVELRKLILGIYQELPANTSWRFVDKSFNFANPANPFTAAFPESKTVAAIQANAMADDFVAIKIGDVNNSVIANSLMINEDRSVGTLVFDVDDRSVKADEVFEVKFKAAEKVTGYQFTLNYSDLELVDVVTTDNMKTDNFAVFSAENALTTSWNGDNQAEFTLKFRAKRTGELSKMLSLSSRITKAEAYKVAVENQPAESLSIGLRFNGKEGSVLTGVGFELYQNEPNPFVNRTNIGFHLPEATTAHLSVYDESGRMVYSQKGDFSKGYNSFMLDKAMIKTTGVLYYTLETETDAATKKMIQAK
jgi:hypothetical protein